MDRESMPAAARAVLFDVDGTLVDAVDNQRQVWFTWARHHDLDPEFVYRVALRTRPLDTFAVVAPDRDPEQCLAALHRLEDEDARVGRYAAFPGAVQLLCALPMGSWALVTSNYEHRVRIRFRRTGLPLPTIVIDAAAAPHGKPHPAPYLLAAELLGVAPHNCLVIEDAPAGVRSGVAAGMTVWTVNTPDLVPGASRRYDTPAAAAADVLRFLDPTRMAHP